MDDSIYHVRLSTHIIHQPSTDHTAFTACGQRIGGSDMIAVNGDLRFVKSFRLCIKCRQIRRKHDND